LKIKAAVETAIYIDDLKVTEAPEEPTIWLAVVHGEKQGALIQERRQPESAVSLQIASTMR